MQPSPPDLIRAGWRILVPPGFGGPCVQSTQCPVQNARPPRASGSCHREVEGCALILGGTDPQYFTGPINWIMVQEEDVYWAIRIDRITINGETVACCEGCKAVVIGPSREINNINGWVGAYMDGHSSSGPGGITGF
ncbi:hypothetical protein NHX12_030797 [Muraenolepis orangiensis]|uniref:Peptidase A1 domain-containing protein n=1 Tax=Muraenolepis orangiensis TaxID=630683 RepID=A0A9Q0EAX0_9TELE|nr:hypothetical protein NHX12_030797 [Muraenolepis orangiensis]